MSNDPSYYAARAIEERRLAMTAEDTKVRRIHLEMAAKYTALAHADAIPINEMPREPEERAG